MITPPKSKKADYLSTNQVRWCSGCGDYHVLSALTSAWAALELPRHQIALISGIGCSSRLPYYTDVFGFHTIHGRAPTVALGLKLAKPDLSVWVITGDGDGLSIGANHLIHLCRRNPNITVLLFNNEIYGLTKGQVSPTSPQGLKTRSNPTGSVDTPLNALALAISSGATFVARVADTDLAMMRDIFQKAHQHQGVSFIEIYTNCVIFNDGAFLDTQKRQRRAQTCVILKEGEPLIFGTNKEKALHFQDFLPTIRSLKTDKKDSKEESSLLIHQPNREDTTYAYALAKLRPPHFPLALGILRQVQKPVYTHPQSQAAHPSTSQQAHTPTRSAKALEETFLKGSFYRKPQKKASKNSPY
ncbi:MAG: 2-oxoacid:ferredoxin oxidoreductase subunit beta [Proteobacteria bacterium]|nr:2-oxoacid:ferredoxin oxidoreductase subunit beta [Pseudomonadota bacterium]